jgi:hypothetical protein
MKSALLDASFGFFVTFFFLPWVHYLDYLYLRTPVVAACVPIHTQVSEQASISTSTTTAGLDCSVCVLNGCRACAHGLVKRGSVEG